MLEIRLNNISFLAGISKTILESAQEHQILIEHSCLSGRCGSCKARVVSGKSKENLFELGLSNTEKNENFILTCVRSPTSDLVLDLNAISGIKLEKPKTLPCKIHEISKIGTDVIKLVLRIPPKTGFNFIPGQYFNLIKGDIKRSYSIAEVTDDNLIAFYIKNYPDGLMSEYLFQLASINDLLRIEGPHGTFFLRNENLENIVFLATGTGIAPIHSIFSNNKNLEYLKSKNVFLFHGGRIQSDLIEKSFFEDLNIHYYPTLSRIKVDGFYHGYIQDVLLKQDIDLSKSTVYACGSSGMIEDSKTMLISSGLAKNQFYSDAFLESN